MSDPAPGATPPGEAPAGATRPGEASAGAMPAGEVPVGVSGQSHDAGLIPIVRALASPVRVRAFAAVVLGERLAPDIARRAGAPIPDALRALLALESAGLARREEDGWHADLASLQRAAADRSGAARPTGLDAPGLSSEENAVLRIFLPEGRIVSLPAQRSKRLIVLDYVARSFEPGVRYPEREVDAVMRVFFDDHAVLRRYLVDEGFLSRDHGQYWRTGGTVD